MITVATGAPRWEDRSVAGHVLESKAAIDSALLSDDLLDNLSRHPDTSIRSSVAVVLFDRAVRSPGSVPLDLVARLATSEPSADLAASWYVYTPARRCLCQLALTRSEVWDVVREMASSGSTEMRNGAASILHDVAQQKPAVVPADLVSLLSHDPNDGVRQTITRTRKLTDGITEVDRRRAYTAFSPF